MFKFRKKKKSSSNIYSLADQSAKWETYVGMFPRPMTAQHLSSYAALREISANLSKSFGVLSLFLINFPLAIISLVSGFLLISVLVKLRLVEGYQENWMYYSVFYVIVFILPFLGLFKDIFSLWRRYFGFSQSESHGSSRYALQAELKSKNLLWKWHPTELKSDKSLINYETTNEEIDVPGIYKTLYKVAKPFISKGLPSDPLANGYLPLATFGFGRWICFPLSLVARHMTFLGPPGSGKSASFFIQQARCFAKLGSAVILDLKGEIFRHSSMYYENVFRIDFQRPETSDRFLLGSLCYKDALAAGEVADLIVGYDPNTDKGGNPFWDQSASMLLKCLLLLLAEQNMNFTPADIFEFIANHQFDEENNVDRLAEVMNNSSNPDIRNSFAPFAQLDGKTKSNILISMAATLKAFQDTTVQIVLSPPTPEEVANGCKIIDPALLRKKGTALYVVVPEGRASQLANVIGTFLGSVANILRRTGDTEDFKGFLDFHARRVARMKAKTWEENEITKRYIEENDLTETIANPSFVLLQYDEAGNVPLRNLSEDIGVGRGRKMCYVLGYQNFDQPEKQYGASVARSILQSIGTKIALTGLTDKTVEYVVKLLGKTTSYEYSSSDALDDRFDNFSKRESSRDLMSESEIRTMPAYTQALVISTDIRPLRVGFPPIAKDIDSYEAAAPIYFEPLQKLKTLTDEAMRRIEAMKNAEFASLRLDQPTLNTNEAGEFVISEVSSVEQNYGNIEEIENKNDQNITEFSYQNDLKDRLKLVNKGGEKEEVLLEVHVNPEDESADIYEDSLKKQMDETEIVLENIYEQYDQNEAIDQIKDFEDDESNLPPIMSKISNSEDNNISTNEDLNNSKVVSLE